MSELFLTKAEVPYDVAAKWKQGRGFADPYAWHQRAWECFPRRDGSTRDFLTRVDAKDNGFQLLILSGIEPSRPDWCPTDNWHAKPIPPELLSHARYRFSLLANPTRKLAVPRDAAGKRQGAKRRAITNREDLLAWLERKGNQHGFAIQPARIRTSARPSAPFLKGGAALPAQRGMMHAVEFSGDLRVVDRERFGEAFRHGIGSGKAFGFGMLCAVPIPHIQ